MADISKFRCPNGQLHLLDEYPVGIASRRTVYSCGACGARIPSEIIPALRKMIADEPENTMENALCFCPHCGEDLRALRQPDTTPAPEPPPAKRELIQREVIRQEIEALWGLQPLPFSLRPIGVVSEDGGKTPLAVACEDTAGKLWECKTGQTKLLDLGTPPTAAQPTVPPHTCSNVGSMAERENAGQERYGSR